MAKAKPGTKKKAKKFKLELSPVSAILWSMFLFFLLMWIFVLGIFVGRGFLPGSVKTMSDLRGRIDRLQRMVSNKETRDYGTSGETMKNPELAFYEKLATKKEEAKNSRQPEERAGIPQQMTQAREEQNLKNKIPGEEDSTGSKNRPETSTSRALHYTVQVASIGDMDRARQVVKDLTNRGYDAYFYETRVEGKTFYRIRCGRFISRGEAQEYALKLETETGFEGLVSRIE